MAKFKPGESGNPTGRPRGLRNKTTLAIEALFDGDAEEITRKAIEKAKEGDITAIRICLERIYPARKDSGVAFDMPKLEKPADAVKAMAAIMSAVSAGDLTPSEAGELSKIVDTFIRTIEATELEQRISAIEKAGAR